MSNNFLNLFVTDAFGNGGISSNFTVLARNLSNSYIVVFRSIIESKDLSDILINVIKIPLLIQKNKVRDINIFLTSPRCLLLYFSLLLLKPFFTKNINVKPIFIVYHPGEFSGNDFFSKIYRRLILTLPAENIWFMNSACYLKHNAFCHQILDPFFFNLVFDDVNDNPKILTRNNLSVFNKDRIKVILTVGRLVGFKINGILSLLDYVENRNVRLVIIGDGPERQNLMVALDRIDSSKYEYLAFVPQFDLKNYYLDADLYFGMGTTLLEASSFDIPCVVSIAGGGKDCCYGWFSDQSDYNVGEFYKGQVIYNLSSFLDDALMLLDVDLNAIRKKQRQHLHSFNTYNTLVRFDIGIDRARFFTQSIFHSLVNFIALGMISIYGFLIWKFFNYNRYDNI